jgi:hypothetical protein
MNCRDAEPLLARLADEESSLPDGLLGGVRSHLAGCAGCRAALDAQREVAARLRARPASLPQPGLVARVSARIDRETGEAAGESWLELANWRRWSAALVPLAAALLAVAYMDLSRASSTTTGTTTSNGVATTLQEWTTADAPMVVQPSVTGDALFEAVLFGSVTPSGDDDVR